MDLKEVLAALNGLPAAEREAIARDALEATKEMVWVPNPGPQTACYESLADETLFGGEPGGGKSQVLIGLALTSHDRSLLLRRTSKEASKFVGEIGDILGSRDCYSGKNDQWILPDGRVIDHGGCQHEDDKQKYKGNPHDLVCVAAGTLVLMGDGSKRRVETLAAGELVQTLEGPRRIEKRHPVQHKHAFRVTVRSADGETLAEQVQSFTHPLLTVDGWRSVADLGGFCGSTGCDEAGSISQSSLRTHALLWQPREAQPLDLLHMAADAQPAADHSPYLVTRASCPQEDVESGFGSFDGCIEAAPTLPSALGPQAQIAPTLHQAERAEHQHADAHATYGAVELSVPQGCRAHCSSCIRLCGGHVHQCAGLSTYAMDVQLCPLQPVYVGRPSPIRSQDDGSARTQTHSRQQRTYDHPYTRETRPVDQFCSLQAGALEFSYVGKVDVYDLQIEEVNHYITDGGIVNRNCFDELTDFTESQYMFIKMWNRSTKPGQRCRVVAASNGPSSAAGLWVVNRWAAWLDPKHPNPAQSGEIRWYIVDDDGKEVEVDGRGPYTVLGREVEAVSRTFIHSRLDDNPDLAATNYGSQLMAQTGVNRQAYALGGFGAMLADDPWQAIPTEWVMQAIARWTPQPPVGVPMCSIGCDVAQGGTDESVIAPRHDGWFAKLETKPGKETPTGAEVAGMVLAKRRDGCAIVIDVGGGFGADAFGHLKGNQIDNVIPYMGVKPSERRTVDNLWKFANVRTQAYWQFREALNPDQPGGSTIALPDDRLLIADLTAPTYWTQANVLHLESKEEITKRMGRSTDRGDAVVMSWYAGARAASDWNRWPASQGGRRMAPKVNLGHSAARRKR